MGVDCLAFKLQRSSSLRMLYALMSLSTSQECGLAARSPARAGDIGNHSLFDKLTFSMSCKRENKNGYVQQRQFCKTTVASTVEYFDGNFGLSFRTTLNSTGCETAIPHCVKPGQHRPRCLCEDGELLDMP